MATLYEIRQEILDCIDQETGEIIDCDRLSQLIISQDIKIENVALWYKNVVSDAEAYKKEKEIFATKQRVAENKAEKLKEWLVHALNGDKFKTSKVSISYRISTSVEVDDINKINNDYLIYMLPAPDKLKIKEALKQGVIVDGAKLTKKQGIQIK